MSCHPRFTQLAYGDSHEQFIRLYRPDGISGEKRPVVFIIHGGYWRQQYNVDNALIDTLPGLVIAQGWWAVTVEYRRGNPSIDGGAGGWPITNRDILLALQEVDFASKTDEFAGLDMSKLVIAGHSAGGHLALWASTSGLSRVVETVPELQGIHLVRPALCVGLSPVGDLFEGFRRKLSDDGRAVEYYMNGPPATTTTAEGLESLIETCSYRLASPSCLLPLACPSILVTGSSDDVVPRSVVLSFCDQVLQVQSPESCYLLDIESADHFSVVTASHEHCQTVFAEVAKALAALTSEH